MFPNINNYRPSSKLLGSVNKYVKKWKILTLPSIFENNSGILTDKMVSDEANEAEEEEMLKDTLSRIYVRNVYNKKLYLLTFNATNVNFRSVYLDRRLFEENENEKCIQSRSVPYYTNKYMKKGSRLNLSKKLYNIDMKNSRLSLMENKKPFMKERPREPGPRVKRNKVSDKVSTVGESVVYLNYNGVYFELYPGVVNLKQSKLIDFTFQETQKKLLAELQMESTEKMKNKARFLVQHKKDLLLFNFTMEAIEYEMVKEKISEGTQVVDNNYYVNAFSAVTDKLMYFSVPQTTYDFIDPMIKVKSRNTYTKIHKLEPFWVHETRNKRLQDYRRCRKDDPLSELQEMKLGSMLSYEANGCVFKAATGAIKCKVADDQYEEWANNQQKAFRVSRPKSSSSNSTREKKELMSTTTASVPDCDLVVYSL